MDQHALHRIAHGGAGALGVAQDAHRHIQIGIFVHIDVAHAVAVPQHRDVAVLHDVAHKGVGAARNDEVDVLVHFEHDGDVLARGQQATPAVRHPRRDARVAQDIEQRLVGAHRFASALEQHRVAALEAQAANLNQCVRTRFKDHADHADGAADAREHQTVGQLGAQLLPPDGILHRGKLLKPRADVFQLVRVEFEPLERGRSQPFLLGLPHVDFVRLEDHVRLRAQRGSHRQQRAAARLARRRGQREARLFGGMRRFSGGDFRFILHRAPLSRSAASPPCRRAAVLRSSAVPASAGQARCGRPRP